MSFFKPSFEVLGDRIAPCAHAPMVGWDPSWAAQVSPMGDDLSPIQCEPTPPMEWTIYLGQVHTESIDLDPLTGQA